MTGGAGAGPDRWSHAYARAFHHAVRGAAGDLTDTIGWLREATVNGDYPSYAPIVAAMGDWPRSDGPAIHWLDDEQIVLARRRALVTGHRELLGNSPSLT
ncbi:hypothetical protein [Streptomyces fuscichromogenes]|uniref:Uncharacterized protein n=1 Tax=Streptomyces fuscichromogenes TaxID=1324013 RepID=A0A917XP45_9ACTN|nr:hypothetical protein [Streptomyces fuscichromogenes]GGN45455.1 hypothetical protein GCM10011578_097400 [Streptomyces fuscichromogenes]